MNGDSPNKVPCPCGSGAQLSTCCQPMLDNVRPAPTAETLMRSRYSAYALQDAAYLLRSWHPDTRPSRVRFSKTQQWTGLTIVTTDKGGMLDKTGVVEFIATFDDDNGPSSIHERSRFARADGAWTYIDGEHDPT